ncbi:MAG TPA: MFS transporter, partial [Puia sp.]|nr:MFS transporter [Puia sp.]
SVTQAGLINNLNDGMAWGLFPIVLATKGFSTESIASITAIYPAVWGIGQLITGRLADKYCKKNMLYIGMLLQGLALILFVRANSFLEYILLASLLGIGTAMVYPTFLATIAENTHPEDRAASLGVFRLWRDSGYAIGAVLTGIVADMFGTNASVIVVGLLTIFSAAIIFYRMKCRDTLPNQLSKSAVKLSIT